ncbi:hypothetical protein M8C13_05135 [Crossiella sp. SN42]|uniref:hypothetical protein n=1 Tax=Crossiella sp. SN42 TaxID=2944808 RepID=UPI00207C2CE8|nr:hypothetical protein [Crossiella sp. SN42]MCO1575142.1 hypothetical protein [Crossiella sp. SN42]
MVPAGFSPRGQDDPQAGRVAPVPGLLAALGLATEARCAGHAAKTIATQGGWRPNSRELYRYMQIVDRRSDNALNGIGP